MLTYVTFQRLGQDRVRDWPQGRPSPCRAHGRTDRRSGQGSANSRVPAGPKQPEDSRRPLARGEKVPTTPSPRHDEPRRVGEYRHLPAAQPVPAPLEIALLAGAGSSIVTSTVLKGSVLKTMSRILEGCSSRNWDTTRRVNATAKRSDLAIRIHTGANRSKVHCLLVPSCSSSSSITTSNILPSM